jgi:hypothetical protein
MRQRRVTGAEYPIVAEIDVELFLHRRFDIDFGKDAKSLSLERLGDAIYDGGEAASHGLAI